MEIEKNRRKTNLYQVSEIMEIGGGGEEGTGTGPRGRGGRPRRIGRRQQVAAEVSAAAVLNSGGRRVVLRVLMGGRRRQSVRQRLVLLRVQAQTAQTRRSVRRQRTARHPTAVRRVPQQQLQRVVHHVARSRRPFGNVRFVQQAQCLTCTSTTRVQSIELVRFITDRWIKFKLYLVRSVFNGR